MYTRDCQSGITTLTVLMVHHVHICKSLITSVLKLMCKICYYLCLFKIVYLCVCFLSFSTAQDSESGTVSKNFDWG